MQYVLYQLNKKNVLKYVNFYNLDRPTDDLMVLLNKAKKKYGRMSQHNMLIHLLKDFREGKLGRITIDEDPDVEVERRNEILEEIRLKEEEENYY